MEYSLSISSNNKCFIYFSLTGLYYSMWKIILTKRRWTQSFLQVIFVLERTVPAFFSQRETMPSPFQNQIPAQRTTTGNGKKNDTPAEELRYHCYSLKRGFHSELELQSVRDTVQCYGIMGNDGISSTVGILS